MGLHQISIQAFQFLFFTSVFLMTALRLPTVRCLQNSTENYYVQARVFVEPEAFSVWTEMSGLTNFEDYTEEIKSYFVELQKTYDSLQESNKISVTFVIESISLMKDDVLEDSTIRNNMTAALQAFQDSVHGDYTKKPYDMALLFTGYPLYKSFGYSTPNKMCTEAAVGIIYQGETQKIVLPMTHQTGHMLGAEHDDDRYRAMPCFQLSGYVMSPWTYWSSPNHYRFSPCSILQLQESLRATTQGNGTRSCLKDIGGIETGKRLGALVSPDSICQRAHGPGYFVSRTNSSTGGVCHSLNCVDANGENMKTVKTLQGMKCGKNKVCNRDVCEESVHGDPLTMDSCPLGDQPKVGTHLNRTCADLDASECPEFKEECCFTCNPENPIFSMTSDNVCEVLVGENYVMERWRRARGHYLCLNLRCMTSTDGVNFDMEIFQAPNGMACGKDKRCAEGRCEQTNYMKPNISDHCPYGDQDLLPLGYNNTCEMHAEEKCGIWKHACCVSCEGKSTKMNFIRPKNEE